MFKQSAISTILDQPIDQLAFSDYFKNKGAQMDIQNIGQVIGLSQKQLENSYGFTNAWMDELTEYAATCGFLELLDDDSRWE